ncbi:MAG TPA: M48 family metallopeptidase [Steroidobacteraceae bacterium]
MHPFVTTFLLVFGLHLVVQAWLAYRQMRHVTAHRGAVPAGFAEVIALGEHVKAADYTVARERLGLLEMAYDAAVLLWLTFGGGIALVGHWAQTAGLPELWTGVLHVLGVFALLSLLGLPFSAYRTFRLEQRFGFNRTTPGVFVADLVKGWLLGAVLGGTILAVVLWVMASTGRYWWLVAWVVWLAFSLLVTWAWPRLIAPLFNKFTALEDGSLRARIDALLIRCGFKASGVYVMDGSRRSAHGNAYFTGLGREKRIVFFDTLLSTLTPVQIESVLAHELGHFKLKHVPKRLLGGAAMSLAGFALLGWLARQDWFYTGLGIDTPGNSAALLLFVLVVPAFAWMLAPLLAAWSRKHEFEADAFAAAHSSGPELAHALVSMYKDNASTLTPDPLHSAFYDSHPPPALRIARLEQAGALRSPAAAPATA